MEESKALQIFNFQEQEVRVTLIDGEPWWLAVDVCTTLGHSDVSMTVSRLDEDEKLIQAMFVSGQTRQTWLVNESGLYHLIFTSRKEEAKTFRRWVTTEVLPSIRKTGNYSASVSVPTATTNITQLESLVAGLLEEVAQLRALVKPKARPVSLQKENARSRVFRYVVKLEAQTDKPVTARDLSRYCTKMPVVVIRTYLEEAAEQGILQAIPTPRTTKYIVVKH